MFDAGPHVSCYRATTGTNSTFLGVRCVKFANFLHCPDQPGVAFVWYAEGIEPSGFYRHFGEAFNPAPGALPTDLTATAAGIVGNGERAEPILHLRFQIPTPPGAVPEQLEVTGDRHEHWTLTPDGIIPDYQPIPRHIERTGPNFTEFTVRKRDGAPGFGVRAMLTGPSWIGAGRWRDGTYLHLGTSLGPPDQPPQFGVSDIAATNRFCGSVPWGELTIHTNPHETPTLLHITGAWSETWQQHPGTNRHYYWEG